MGNEEVAVKTVNRLHVTPQLTERDALRVMHKVVVPSWFPKIWPFDDLAAALTRLPLVQMLQTLALISKIDTVPTAAYKSVGAVTSVLW